MANMDILLAKQLIRRSELYVENLIVAQLIKKFQYYNGKRKFIVAFTKALLWATLNQFNSSHPSSAVSVFIIILPSMKR